MFIASAGFTVILKPTNFCILFTINMAIYLVASAATVFDLVIVVIGATDDDHSTLRVGYPDHLAKIRMLLGLIVTYVS